MYAHNTDSNGDEMPYFVFVSDIKRRTWVVLLFLFLITWSITASVMLYKCKEQSNQEKQYLINHYETRFDELNNKIYKLLIEKK